MNGVRRYYDRWDPTACVNVYVDGRLVAADSGMGPQSRLRQRIRGRLSDEWWQRMDEILQAQAPLDSGSPFGDGIVFYLGDDDANGLYNGQWWTDIEADCFDACREIITQAIDQRTRRVIPVLDAIKEFRCPSP